jgi:hypothetical protein
MPSENPTGYTKTFVSQSCDSLMGVATFNLTIGSSPVSVSAVRQEDGLVLGQQAFAGAESGTYNDVYTVNNLSNGTWDITFESDGIEAVHTLSFSCNLSLVLAFDEPTTGAPVDGYIVKYRKVGTSVYTTITPNPTASPVLIEPLEPGQNYEGTIAADCGDGSQSAPVVWGYESA